MRQRRRAERGRYAQARDANQPAMTRREVESRQRRLLLIGVGFVLLVVIGLLAYGWLTSSYFPPRRTVATIDGTQVQLRDVVPYTVLDAVETGSGTVNVNASVNNVVRDLILEKRGPDLGVTLDQADVEQRIVNRFEPLPPGSTEPADSLSDEGRQNFTDFLESFDLTEAEYRNWLNGRVYVNNLRQHFVDQQPEVAEQVFVHWIVTQTESEADAARERLDEGEPFEEVAADVNIESNLADENGEVGWVRRNALPSLDEQLFAEDLEHGVVQEPVSTAAGYVLFKVTEGPSEEPTTDLMNEVVADNEFQSWLDEQVAELLVEQVNLSEDDLAWVRDQVL